jgi:hypothetical protein
MDGRWGGLEEGGGDEGGGEGIRAGERGWMRQVGDMEGKCVEELYIEKMPRHGSLDNMS